MLHASEMVRNVGRGAEFGFAAGEAKVDGAAFMGRVASVVGHVRQGVETLLRSRKVEMINGRGRLIAPDALAVETETGATEIKAKAVIIATGSRPARLDFLPWESGRIMTTDEATTAGDLPESVLIIGGGYIGCEFATVYSELGIPTTVVEMLDRLVPNQERDVSRIVTKSLEERRVRIVTGARIAGVRATDAGLAAALEGGETVEASRALLAVGRVRNIENIGLEDAGVAVEEGMIRVDECCRTNVEGVYAIGDVAETRQFAHLASRMGIVAADNATGHPAEDSRAVVPAGIFTHPEVATVGLSDTEARQAAVPARISRFPYMASGMARAYGETEGLVKIAAEADSGRILGATVVGQHATDVIQEIAVAMRSGTTVEQLAETIHTHPTFSEAVMEAAESWLGLPTHTLR
jgi:dihydrolipoamide dehydrogenase